MAGWPQLPAPGWGPQESDCKAFFTDTKSITLDPIYVQASSRLQRAARAVSTASDAELALLSPVVMVHEEDGDW